MTKKIRVGVVGVGNCCKSLIEGVTLYSNIQSTDGLAFEKIGGYKPEDIEFVLAYDVDKRKTNTYLRNAIYSKPNCAMDMGVNNWVQDVCGDTLVYHGAVLDGVASHMLELPEDEGFRIEDYNADISQKDIINDLKTFEVDVLINYLPVGSENATRFYLGAAIKAKVPFINCIPVFFVSDPENEKTIREAGIPAIGDDMRSQLGASVMSQALQELFFNRGMQIQFHEQTNHGGNTDFATMLDQKRLASKKISKENVIRSQNDIRGIPVPKNGIYAGPSSYIPYHGDNKVAHFRIEATGFGGAKVTFDARLSVEDSPNSAGVVIDAIRYLKVAQEMGMVGSLRGPSAATQKTPPTQLMIDDAYKECQALANREWTNMTRKYNSK